MRRIAAALLTVCSLILSPSLVLAQDKTRTEEAKPALVPLRVQITFSEYEGDKKVKSLPYEFVVSYGAPPSSWAKVRIGSRVPIYTGGPNGAMTYLDVGTNIDCRAVGFQEGKYELTLSLERSWVDGDLRVPVGAPGTENSPAGTFPQPIVRQFRSELTVSLRDGQTVKTNFSTDPISGKVMKLDVSLEVLK